MIQNGIEKKKNVMRENRVILKMKLNHLSGTFIFMRSTESKFKKIIVNNSLMNAFSALYAMF